MRRLFLLTLVAVALFTKTAPGSAHEYSRFGTVESLVERGTLQLDDSIFIGTVDKIFRDGHYYSHQPPLLAVIEAPVYWVLRTPGIRFNNRGRFLITYLFILLTNGVALALTVVVFARLLELSGVPPPARDLWAVLLVAGTWLLPYGLVSNNHGISALLTAVLIWQLLLVEWRGVTTARAAAIGAAVGLLVAIELLPVVSFLPLTFMLNDVLPALIGPRTVSDSCRSCEGCSTSCCGRRALNLSPPHCELTWPAKVVFGRVMISTCERPAS